VGKVNGKQAEIGVKESSNIMQYVTMKAYEFPFINVLWGGIVITAIGIFISMGRRIRINRLAKES